MHAYPPASWLILFPTLELWQALSPDQRRHALTLQPVYQTLPPPLRALPRPLLQALFESDDKGRLRPLPPFRKLLSLLERLAHWSGPEGPLLTPYVKETTLHAQRMALTGIGNRAPPDQLSAAMEQRMSAGWFTRTLLEMSDAITFLNAVGNWTPSGIEYTQARHEALRNWVTGNFKRKRTGFALGAGPFEVPGSPVPPEELLALLLAYGIAFVGFHHESLNPVLQIMVPHDAPAQSLDNLDLRPHAAVETFLRPFLIDDIDAFLRAVKSEPMPLLSDGFNAPVAQLRRMAKVFPPLPVFLQDQGYDGEHRAMAAWWMIGQMGLASGEGRGAKNMRAHLNPKGQDWLALPREKKLMRLLEEVPVGRRSTHRLGDWFSWLGEHFVHPFPYLALRKEVMDWMDGTVEKLRKPADQSALLESAAAKANPFRADIARDPALDARWARWEEPPGVVYAKLLAHHLARLASLGALAASRDKGGRMGVTLSPVGLWLYGMADAWTLPGEARKVAVVGADFGIVFTEPDAGLEAELQAFAEPLGRPGQAGLAFRLTRASVQAGAHRGLTAEDMLGLLAAGSRTPVPPNVLHEVKAWAGGKRTVILREALLVECEDTLALAELHSQQPRDFERVSPTVLRYTGGSNRAALAKRLAKKGFYPE